MTIDLNCDMGEGMPPDSYRDDADIMPFISSANIACGYHAGDKTTIRKTIDLCLHHGVAIGAHPGFDDKPNFGRVPIQLSQEEYYQLVYKQLEIIQAICTEKQATLHHVKPHGALYNMAAKDKALSHVIAQAVYDFNPRLIYYGLSGSVMISEAKAIGLKTANEVFADRTYQSDGSLTPRKHARAMIENSEEAVSQVLQILIEGTVTALTGEIIPLKADSICIHGDGKHALPFAKSIYSFLMNTNIAVQAL